MSQRDTDQFIQHLREAIAKWKQEQLMDSLHDEQDTTKLNGYLKITALAYEMIKTYLHSQGTERYDPSLQPIIKAIGPISGLTDEEIMLVEHYLVRDLVEYPFTYNTRLINSFEKRNILNTKIVPNK